MCCSTRSDLEDTDPSPSLSIMNTIKHQLVFCFGRHGHAPSAEACATAVCVGKKRAVVQLVSWWDWPATVVMTMSMNIWRGMPLNYDTILD